MEDRLFRKKHGLLKLNMNNKKHEMDNTKWKLGAVEKKIMKWKWLCR